MLGLIVTHLRGGCPPNGTFPLNSPNKMIAGTGRAATIGIWNVRLAIDSSHGLRLIEIIQRH